MSGGEVIGEPLPEPFAVGGPDLAALLELDDAAADFPVSGGKHRPLKRAAFRISSAAVPQTGFGFDAVQF